MTLGMVLGYVAPKPADAIKWGLSGFSDGTVWLIFGALGFRHGIREDRARAADRLVVGQA